MAPAGIGALGITNSGALPEVRPRPTNPRLLRPTGDAIPGMLLDGNSITLKDDLSRIPSLFAICLALSPRKDAASVTKTSLVRPKPRSLTFPGTTRANVVGIGLLTKPVTLGENIRPTPAPVPAVPLSRSIPSLSVFTSTSWPLKSLPTANWAIWLVPTRLPTPNRKPCSRPIWMDWSTSAMVD